MNNITVKSTNLEEAYRKCEEGLRATKSQLQFDVFEEEVKGKTIYCVTATLLNDYPMKGLEYLKTVLETLGINAMVEMRRRHGTEIRYVITSDENPILIGKGGKTLESIETLVKMVANPNQDDRYTISVDCGGYKQQRIKQLEILATKTAKDVAESKVSVSLDPMNSYERRVVHEKLSNWKDVYTESEGSGKERHIVIKPR